MFVLHHRVHKSELQNYLFLRYVVLSLSAFWCTGVISAYPCARQNGTQAFSSTFACTGVATNDPCAPISFILFRRFGHRHHQVLGGYSSYRSDIRQGLQDRYPHPDAFPERL